MAKDMHRHDETFFELLDYLESKITVKNPRNYMFQSKLKFEFVHNDRHFFIFLKHAKLSFKKITSQYILENLKFYCEECFVEDGLDIKDTLDNIILAIKEL